MCNGGVASAAAVLYLISAGMGELPLKLSPRRVDPPILYALACLSALCCSCGDTWASEVGSVLGGNPRLITTWQIVPRGTNGGVSGVGILCSIGGGLVVGLAYFLTLFVSLGVEGLGNESLVSQLPVVLIGGVAGLFGSVFEILFGSNNSVHWILRATWEGAEQTSSRSEARLWSQYSGQPCCELCIFSDHCYCHSS